MNRARNHVMNDPNNNVVAVRRFETNNDYIGMKPTTKIILIISLIIFTLFSLALTCYMYIATTLLNNIRPTLQTIDVDTISLTSHGQDKTAMSLEACLDVSFIVPSVVMAMPKVATFGVSTRLNETQMVRAFATSTFQIVDYDQLLCPTFFTEQLSTTLIRKMSDNELIWIELTGDMEMKLMMEKFPLFPHRYQHIYIRCVVSVEASEQSKIHTKTCETSLVEPFQS